MICLSVAILVLTVVTIVIATTVPSDSKWTCGRVLRVITHLARHDRRRHSVCRAASGAVGHLGRVPQPVGSARARAVAPLAQTRCAPPPPPPSLLPLILTLTRSALRVLALVLWALLAATQIGLCIWAIVFWLAADVSDACADAVGGRNAGLGVMVRLVFVFFLYYAVDNENCFFFFMLNT